MTVVKKECLYPATFADEHRPASRMAMVAERDRIDRVSKVEIGKLTTIMAGLRFLRKLDDSVSSSRQPVGEGT
jgi:hypothetical protein